MQLTDSERNALTAAIDAKTLAQRKWRIGDTGEIVDERDRFAFNPGFATGIDKKFSVERIWRLDCTIQARGRERRG